MKVSEIRDNRRRKELVFHLADGSSRAYPYARLDPEPTAGDPIVDVAVDDELAAQGVSYRLESGREGVVLVDQVLDYHADPDYVRVQLLHKLTVEARRRFEGHTMGVRALARRLGTSPAQVYRLLDTANNRKSLDAMVRVLQALDARVSVTVGD